MSINWATIEPISSRKKSHSGLKKVITAQNYGFDDGEWTLTELVQSTDPRKFLCYQILEGVQPDGRRHPGSELKQPGGAGPFLFRFEVLTRQACCRTKDGHKIWETEEALEYLGDENDIVADAADKAVPGDIVEWKGFVKTWDDDGDRPVDAGVKREWALKGIRPENFVELEVDDDGCIWVPYPYALSMLQKYGERLSFPQFKKKDKQKPTRRRITNWWFREVHPQEPLKKKKGK